MTSPTVGTEEHPFNIDVVQQMGQEGLVIATTNPVTGGVKFSAGGSSVDIARNSTIRDALNMFADGTPRAIAAGASVKSLLAQPGINATPWGGTPTLEVVTGLNADGTPIGVTYTATGLTGTPVSRTGMSKMLKMVVNNGDGTTMTGTDAVKVTCSLAAGGIASAGTAAAMKGSPLNVGLWVWISKIVGQDPNSSSVGGVVQMILTANNSGTGGTTLGFNNNQLTEGWNFLKFVDTRNTVAAGSHPLGISAAFAGGSSDPFDSAGANGAVRNVILQVSGFPAGATIIFDSVWTGISSRPAFVLGCDAMGADLIAYALPKFAQHGIPGYVAAPRSVVTSNWAANVDRMNIVGDYSYSLANLTAAAAAGWPIWNHTMTHPNTLGGTSLVNMRGLTAPEDIRYEVLAWEAWARGIGLPTDGSEFYAAPQGASSRLSEIVIKNTGAIKLQRVHGQQNVQRTPWGVPNIHHVGSWDFGDQAYQNTWANIKATIDKIIVYGDVGFPFWHIIATAGDTGDANTAGLTGDSLKVYRSVFDAAIDYLASLRDAGQCDLISGQQFYYGEA